MKSRKLSKGDLQLIEMARSMVGRKEVSGGVVKAVGSVLLTKEGRVFTGVNIDLWCGIGFCAEHSAIADMVSHSDEVEIKAIVAHDGSRVMPPCGRCRELMELIDTRNRDNTEIIISEGEKVKLKELLPCEWIE